MKVSRRHFIETNQHIADQVRMTASDGITSFNYGILPHHLSSGNRGFDCQVLCDVNQHIYVRIRDCEAIAPDGSRIDIAAANEIAYTTALVEIVELYQLALNQPHFFYVILTVHLFQSAPFGEPDEEELPPRHPFSVPEYSIHVLPVQHVTGKHWGGNHLVVAKIAYADNALRVVTEYLPPCHRISALADLKNWYNRWMGYLKEIETLSYRIVRKVKQKSQKSVLSDSVQQLAEGLACTIAGMSGNLRWLIPEQPPIYMLAIMVQVAERIKVETEFLPDREKEELLSYLAEWADGTPGSLQAQLAGVIQVSYSHLDCISAFQVIDSFFAIWTALFSKLSQLEFIGKRKGQQVFIIESPVHEPPSVPEKPKSRWSPI